MKKKLSLIIIFLISIIFIPKNVFASTPNIGNINTLEKARDYCYFKYIKGTEYNVQSFAVYNSSDKNGTDGAIAYRCGFSSGTEVVPYFYNNKYEELIFSSYTNPRSITCYTNIRYNYDYDEPQSNCWTENNSRMPMNNPYLTTSTPNNLISNIDILYNGVSMKTDFPGVNSFTYQDIECKYNTSECESGGGSGGESEEPEEPTPEEPTQITTNELYQLGVVGITVVCVLICMLFLKWCFPMKGGRKI